MALFKILKGNSARIDTSVTPFHDGYAYFTPDDGGFYIDSEDDGVQKRIRINPPSSNGSKALSSTLSCDSWEYGMQTLTIEGVTGTSNGVIGVSQNATDGVMNAAKQANLFIINQGEDTITIAALGPVPSIDIPITIILMG